MSTKSSQDQNVEVNFESHPPIETDLDGISALLRQTFLQYTDCQKLAEELIQLKDVTQVIALAEQDVETTQDAGDDEVDEPDDDIYGVSTIIDISSNKDNDKSEAIRSLLKFLKDKSPEIKELFKSDGGQKMALLVNERYINLPPQLALPTLKGLQQHIENSGYSHIILLSKILLKSRQVETKLPSKKAKSSSTSENDEPLVFVNAEEEIIWENSECYSDVDVSAHCDENATWAMGSDVKYIPHRRIMLIEAKKWPTIMKCLEEELKSSS